MSFRQTYKGIFQFIDQPALERAMAEIQAEAMGADALGLQDCYHSPGVMLVNIDITASVQDWEEMAVALATLAMHAGRGFCYATAFDGGETGPRQEYYQATGPVKIDLESYPALAASDDYFPMRHGTLYKFHVEGIDGLDSVEWTLQRSEVNGHGYYQFENSEHQGVHYNELWEGAFYHKRGPIVDVVLAGDESDLMDLDRHDRYAIQSAYSSLSKKGDVGQVIWMDGDHFLEYVVEGFENLQLSMGTLLDCMRVRMDLYHVMGSEMYRESQVQHFAKGHGLVRWQKGHVVLSITNG